MNVLNIFNAMSILQIILNLCNDFEEETEVARLPLICFSIIFFIYLQKGHWLEITK